MLFEHQKKIIKFIRENRKCLVVCPMGSGKTRAVLNAIDNALIIAPKLVAMKVWPEEAQNVLNRKCEFIKGGKEYTKGLSFYSTNFENTHIYKPDGITNLVIDESSRLKGFQFRQGAKRAKFIYELSKQFDRVILLTGTPCSESLGDLYSQICFIDNGATFGKSKFQFMCRYHFDLSRSNKFHIWQPKPNAQQEIMNACKAFVRYFEPEIKTFGKYEQVLEFEQPAIVHNAIKELKNNKVVMDDDKVLYAKNSAILATKLLHLASGFGYLEDTKNKTLLLSEERAKFLREVVNDIGERCVIVAYWKASIDLILSQFELHEITTDIDWFKDGKAKHLLISPARAAHGLNLQCQSNHMIIYEPFYSCEQYEQVLERIGERRQAQAGLNRPVFYHYICSNTGIDKTAFDALKMKSDVQAAIIDLMSCQQKSSKKINEKSC